MSCTYARVQTQNLPTLGDGGFTQTETLCQLREQSKAKCLEVYQRLFDLGIEASIVTSTCPVAINGEWGRCPNRKPVP